jgi:hypothetical protein
MRKILKARNAGFLALALASFGWMAATAVAQAQTRERYRQDTLSNSSYERMRQWSRELDQVADKANRQAQADQAGYRGFRRDSNFLQSIDHFARRAREFRARMDAYRTRPWNVDDELGHLLSDARTVQNRIQRARFVDAGTRRDWNRVVELLNRMIDEFRNRGRYRDDRYGNDRFRRNDDRNGRNDDRYGRSEDRNPGSYADSTDLRQLAVELDERASRIAQMADQYGSRVGSSGLRRFSSEARDFRTEVESRRFSQSELRDRVNRLLSGAQVAHNEISGTRVTSEVASEWEGIVQVLNRMRDLVV